VVVKVFMIYVLHVSVKEKLSRRKRRNGERKSEKQEEEERRIFFRAVTH